MQNANLSPFIVYLLLWDNSIELNADYYISEQRVNKERIWFYIDVQKIGKREENIIKMISFCLIFLFFAVFIFPIFFLPEFPPGSFGSL